MKKPFGTGHVTQTVINAGAAIKHGTATKLCTVAASPYFGRKLVARRRMREHITRDDVGYCLDRPTFEE